MDNEQIMKAHQYLYYVLGFPVLTDQEYDRFCSDNGLFGGGGSDRDEDYSADTKALADAILELGVL